MLKCAVFSILYIVWGEYSTVGGLCCTVGQMQCSEENANFCMKTTSLRLYG